MLSVLSWNIQQGGGSRVQSILNKLINSKSQILILSEFRNNKNGRLIRQVLLDAGYRYQVVSAADADTNAVAIFSKVPCNSQLFNDTGLDFSYDLALIDIGVIHIIGVYLPHKKKHKLFDLLIEHAQRDVPLIIAGDFNTGKNFIDQKGDSFWYTDKLLQLEKSSMIDAFRALHGDQESYSWYSHQGNGYRYDHTYVSQVLRPTLQACYYEHSWREEKLSDHSPMFLNLA